MTRSDRRRAPGPAAPGRVPRCWAAVRGLWREAGVRARDAGSATAELAASLPALVLLLFVALAAVSALRIQIECVDAARDAALAAARGDDGVRAGQRVAPSGASVGLADDDDLIRATVTVRVRPLGGRLPSFTITTSALAAKEPTLP